VTGSRIPIPSIIERATGLLKMQFRNSPDILGYRIRVANSLNNAYGPDNGVGGTGTEAIFDLTRDQSWRSKAIRVKGWGIEGDSIRGLTRAFYDPNEFYNPPTTTAVPPDNALTFMRVQVRTVASPTFPGVTNNLNQSAILIVNDPGFFTVPRPALTLYGTAPSVGAVPGLPPPPESLVFHVPAFADAMVVTNHGTGTLYLSVGRSLPMMQINEGSSISHSSGMKDELVLAASGANPSFSILLSTVTGQR
jgi:hypothetical protein